MKEITRRIGCVCFPYDAHFQGCDYVPPPQLAVANGALKKVFDGNCPFVLHFKTEIRGYFVFCSREPDSRETEMIKLKVASPEASTCTRAPGTRTEIFYVDPDSKSDA